MPQSHVNIFSTLTAAHLSNAHIVEGHAHVLDTIVLYYLASIEQ
jgi:hypothetical protein